MAQSLLKKIRGQMPHSQTENDLETGCIKEDFNCSRQLSLPYRGAG